MNSKKINLWIIYGSLGFLLLKIGFYLSGLQHDMGKKASMIFLLFLLVTIAYIAADEILKQDASFWSAVRKTLRKTMLFSLLITLITYAYYQWIDADFFATEIHFKLKEYYKNGTTDRSELLKHAMQMQQILNPYAHALITLMTLTIGSIFYTLFSTLILKYIRPKFLK